MLYYLAVKISLKAAHQLPPRTCPQLAFQLSFSAHALIVPTQLLNHPGKLSGNKFSNCDFTNSIYNVLQYILLPPS